MEGGRSLRSMAHPRAAARSAAPASNIAVPPLCLKQLQRLNHSFHRQCHLNGLPTI